MAEIEWYEQPDQHAITAVACRLCYAGVQLRQGQTVVCANPRCSRGRLRVGREVRFAILPRVSLTPGIDLGSVSVEIVTYRRYRLVRSGNESWDWERVP